MTSIHQRVNAVVTLLWGAGRNASRNGKRNDMDGGVDSMVCGRSQQPVFRKGTIAQAPDVNKRDLPAIVQRPLHTISNTAKEGKWSTLQQRVKWLAWLYRA